MSKTTLAFTLLLAAFVLTAMFTATKTFALAGVFPNDKPYECAGIPKDVLAAINKCNRVYGWGNEWGSHNGYQEIYFQGDTDQLNEFLAGVAKMKNEKSTTLKVCLISEAGHDKAFLAEDKKFDYNWALHFSGLVKLDAKGGWTEDSYLSVYVDIHVCDKIDVKKLSLPLAYQASVGGRVVELVDQHNERREDTIAATQPDTRPTTYVDRTHNVFGTSTTQPE